MSSPIMSKLHPTLKACKCGYIGVRKDLYRHLDQVQAHYRRCEMTTGEFFADHGEVPLNEDDSRLNTTTQLEHSLTRQEKLKTL